MQTIPVSEPSIRKRSAVMWLAVAAGLVIIAAFAFLRPHRATSDHEQQLTLVAPRDGGMVSSKHYRFKWLRHPGSTAYQFSLYEANRSLLWSALVRDTSLAVPGSVSLAQGETYLWRVDAIMPDETMIHSDVQAFRFSE